MSPRRIVVALAVVDVGSWFLAGVGVGGNVPGRSYVIFDVVLEAVLLVGLWFLWRVAWWIAVAVAALGEVFELVHTVDDFTGRRLVLLGLGLVYLGLLMLPRLRQTLRPPRRGQAA